MINSQNLINALDEKLPVIDKKTINKINNTPNLDFDNYDEENNNIKLKRRG